MQKIILLSILILIINFSSFSQKSEKLFSAVADGNLKKVTKLIEKGTDVNALSTTKWNALAYASKYNFIEIVKYLIEHNANINQQVNIGSTPIQIAVNAGNFEVAEYLCSKDAELEIQNILGLTPLGIAVADGDLIAVKFFVENGSDINAMNKQQETILDLASSKAIKEYLIIKGAKTSAELFKAQ